jgi:cytochrome c oxidase cbb3-type subunit I/II
VCNNDNWHFNHLNPQSISAGSIMPGYKWLFDNKPMDVSLTQKKMQVMATLEFLTQKVKLQVV